MPRVREAGLQVLLPCGSWALSSERGTGYVLRHGSPVMTAQQQTLASLTGPARVRKWFCLSSSLVELALLRGYPTTCRRRYCLPTESDSKTTQPHLEDGSVYRARWWANVSRTANFSVGGTALVAGSKELSLASSHGPALRKDFSLLQHRLGCLFLFVRRVAVPTENTTYEDLEGERGRFLGGSSRW